MDLARKFAEETYNVKVEHERRFNKILNPVKSFMETFWDLTEQYPWLLPVILIVVVLVLVGLTALFFGRKSAEAPHLKKTDEIQPDDEMDEVVQVYFIYITYFKIKFRLKNRKNPKKQIWLNMKRWRLSKLSKNLQQKSPHLPKRHVKILWLMKMTLLQRIVKILLVRKIYHQKRPAQK